MSKTKFKNKTQQQYIVYDSRARCNEDAATVLEEFADNDDARAMKYAKTQWPPSHGAVLYRRNRGGDTTYVGVVK